MTATSIIIHYIYDPLCGWCYGAGPLIDAASDAGFKIQLHAGGLWGEKKHIDPAFVDHIRSNDSSITSLTRQPFGKPYLKDLLEDPKTIVWSQPTIDAVLAAGKLAGSGEKSFRNELEMIHAIQKAYYVSGRQVADTSVLVAVAKELGLDGDAFEKKLNPAAAVRHIKQTRKLMKTAGVSGFPNFLIEKQGSAMVKIDHSKHYGKPDKFVKVLQAAT